MEEKKTINEWKEAFADLYEAMRNELGSSDLDVRVTQNCDEPTVFVNIMF